jgi:hypothetical protein
VYGPGGAINGVLVGVGVGVGDIGHGLAATQVEQLGYNVCPFHTTLIGPDC